MKRRKCEKNIWRSHRVGFLGQSRESWICMRPTMIRWKTCKIIKRWPWHTGGRTVDSILLRGFDTNFILICYISLLSQAMSYGLGVWQGCNRWRIPWILRSNVSSGWRPRRRRDYHGRSNNRGGMRYPGLGNITLQNRKRRTDVLELLSLGIQPLRQPPHVWSQVFFLCPFIKIIQYIVIVVWKVLRVYLLSCSYCSFYWWTRHWFNRRVWERHVWITSEARGWGTWVLLWWRM
jgi:hypothetical protein